jgi:hypothetical protein
MIDPLSALGVYGAYWLNKKLAERSARSVPECRLCPSPAAKSTDCCGTPLCAVCLHQWQHDPHPCPCKRR